MTPLQHLVQGMVLLDAGPARADVLKASCEEQEYHHARRGGQNQRDAVARQNKEANKRLPVMVGDVGTLRPGLERGQAPVPREVGLQSGKASWKPLEKGTSLFPN